MTRLTDWYQIDGPMGGESVEVELVGDFHADDPDLPRALADFIENDEIWEIERVRGYGVRASAPGYMDRTDWEVFQDRGEAEARFREVDSELGGDDYSNNRRRRSHRSNPGSRAAIVDAMARAFFVNAWASEMEELCPEETRSWSGQNLYDLAPENSPEAEQHAEQFARDVERANGSRQLGWIYDMARARAKTEGEGDFDEDSFGYLVSMEAMGHGVSLADDSPSAREMVNIPDSEFYDVVLDCAPAGTYVGNRRHGRNARGAPADEHAAHELVVFIDNTSDLSLGGPRGQGHDIVKNLVRKWRKGQYDFEKSVKLMQYLTESGAKRYAREFDDASRWHQIFSPATRRLAARELADQFRQSAEAGEYDDMDVRIQRNPGGPEAASSDHEVYLNVGTYGVEVIVAGPDSRVIQSVESDLRSVAEEKGGVVDDRNPEGIRLPHGWGYMGFTVEDEPNYIGDLAKDLRRAAEQHTWVNRVRMTGGGPGA